LKRPFTEWPPAAALGRSGDVALAERFAAALAAELRAVGINLDYAPVLDVWTNPKNRVIGDRALGDRADVVGRMGAAIVRTLQREGVTACGKHFPGHGDTIADSHDELPLVEHPPDRLEAIELEPFRAAIAEDVAAIMMAHVMVPAVDADRPASLSPTFVQTWLKARLAFQGVVVCDDLGMKAVSGARSMPVTTVEAIAAGCDVVLLCNSTADEQMAALEAVIHAAEAQALTSARLDDAFARQERVKRRWLRPPTTGVPSLDSIGGDRHQAIAAEMASWQ
jgi:beta-N-acetylhexosaminidase